MESRDPSFIVRIGRKGKKNPDPWVGGRASKLREIVV